MRQSGIIQKIKKITSFLKLLCVLLVLGIAVNIYFFMARGNEEAVEPIGAAPLGGLDFQSTSSFSQYERVLTSKKVFKPPLYRTIIEPETSKEGVLEFQGTAGIGDDIKAVIYDTETNSLELYSVGDYVRDLKITKIENSGVTLSKGAESIKLTR